MTTLLERLPKKARRGSKARCHGLTHGNPEDVAARLTQLIAPFGVVSPEDHWMPQGFDQLDEAELHKAVRLLYLDKEHCAQIRRWWFAIFKGGLQTGPSFDIASTCMVTVANQRKRGILLVEAKAHDEELIKEEGAKPLKENPSEGQETNHKRIGEAINAANEPFTLATGFSCSLSRDTRYQMSNRFASACKLAELGYPVILVYLGFLNAKEMADQGKVLENATQWDALVKLHSMSLFPEEVWNQSWTLYNQPFVPLICSVEWPLEPEIQS